jgi:hypothetical protein
LPSGWLDTPRSEAEIPESVSHLLMPASRGRASVEQSEPRAATTMDGVPGKAAGAKVNTGRARVGVVGTGPESFSSVAADVAGEKATIAVSQQDHVADAPDEPASRVSDESDGEVPATAESFPAVATPQQSPELPPPSVTSLDHLQGIAPIAEALLKTLAGKARTGRLDELKALELLQQAVLL